jgi:hypothetical protein
MQPEADSDGRSTRKLSRLRFLDGIDWRIVGMTAVFAALAEPGWAEDLTDGQWGTAVRDLAEAELFGLLILIFAAALFRWRARGLSRPLALTLAVIAGCFAARAITLPPYVGTWGADFPGGEPSYWTLLWFWARKSMMLWASSQQGGIPAVLDGTPGGASAIRARAKRAQTTRRSPVTGDAGAGRTHFLFNTRVKRLYKTDPVLAQRCSTFAKYLHAAMPRCATWSRHWGQSSRWPGYLDVRDRMGDRLVEIAIPDGESGTAVSR